MSEGKSMRKRFFQSFQNWADWSWNKLCPVIICDNRRKFFNNTIISLLLIIFTIMIRSRSLWLIYSRHLRRPESPEPPQFQSGPVFRSDFCKIWRDFFSKKNKPELFCWNILFIFLFYFFFSWHVKIKICVFYQSI